MKYLMNNTFTRGLLLVAFTISIAACGGSAEQETANQDSETEMTMQADTASAPSSKLNLNTASGGEFQTIPNVGDKMVHEFEEYRPYVSIQQFRKEIAKYVDSSRVAAYEQYVFVPVHRNDSDKATLLQIPGLDRDEADKLIADRPYDTNESFLDALSSFISEDQMSTAKIYLKTE
jgi:radical SAM superfamily enzyme with C-terminal helix-hairpin-helix motif